MDSDGEDSDGVSRKLKEDEFELPRVMWVPDRLENQDDLLKRSKPHESFQAAPCTQTTESSRLLRNPFREPHQHHESVTSTSSTSTTAFTTGVVNSNPSARRLARRIRSLPSPYSASCSNTSSSRRSTVGGTSSNRTQSAPSLATSTGHGDVSSISVSVNDTSLVSSGTDSLGSLMTRLGERFSRRNEARKKRAEMQVTIANGQKQRQQGQVEAQQLSNPPSSVRRNQPTTNQLSESHSFRQHVPSTRINDRLVKVNRERQRYPLAKGDANQNQNQNQNQTQNSSESAQKRPKVELSPYTESGATKSMQKLIVIQQNDVQYTRPLEQMDQRQGFSLKPANKNNPAIRTVNPAIHASPAFRQRASMEPITANPGPPLAIAEADNDTGHHHNSDTSFESLNDMDGLLSGGGEEVEALFRACDGF